MNAPECVGSRLVVRRRSKHRESSICNNKAPRGSRRSRFRLSSFFDPSSPDYFSFRQNCDKAGALVRLQMRPSTVATVFFAFLCGNSEVWSRPSGEDEMSRDGRGLPPSICKPQPHHHSAFGQWAARANETHKMSLMAPSLHRHSFRTVNEEDLRENDVLAGNTDCPATPVYSPDEPIMGRSLCPWYWKVNFNPTRIPAMLPEAVCRCRRAVTGINGVVVYECQPLTMQIRVLQLDADCKEYQERSIETAVACVSVVQSSMRLNKIAGIEQTGHPRLMQEI